MRLIFISDIFYRINKKILIIVFLSISLITGIIIIVNTNASGDSDESEEDYYNARLIENGYPNSYYGIEIEETEIGDHFAQITLKDDGSPIIQVGSRFFLLSAKEKQWVLAHELGHWVLDHFGDRANLEDDVREFETDFFAYFWTGIDPFDLSFGTEYTLRLFSEDYEENMKWWDLCIELFPYVNQKTNEFSKKYWASLE